MKQLPKAPAPTRTAESRRLKEGVLLGLAVALSGSIYMVSARAGTLSGFGPPEAAMLRFGVGGLATLPVLLSRNLPTLDGMGWLRGLALLMTAGPALNFLQIGGYAYAPLTHGAVLMPATVTLASMLLAVLTLGERPTAMRIMGTALVVAGLILVSWQGAQAEGSSTWVGDLMFVSAGALWAIYTVLLKRWKIDATYATAVVSTLSTMVILPPYLMTTGLSKFSSFSGLELAMQVVCQGVVGGLIMTVAYTRCVHVLGAANAAVFPSMVPALATLLGIWTLNEWPSSFQLAGLGMATIGLVAAIGVVEKLLEPAALKRSPR